MVTVSDEKLAYIGTYFVQNDIHEKYGIELEQLLSLWLDGLIEINT